MHFPPLRTAMWCSLFWGRLIKLSTTHRPLNPIKADSTLSPFLQLLFALLLRQRFRLIFHQKKIYKKEDTELAALYIMASSQVAQRVQGQKELTEMRGGWRGVGKTQRR